MSTTEAQLEFGKIVAALDRLGKPITSHDSASGTVIKSECPNHHHAIDLFVNLSGDEVVLQCLHGDGCAREDVLALLGVDASSNGHKPPTATTAAPELQFAAKVGELFDVPLVSCPPKPGEEFSYPAGERDLLSSNANQDQLDKWQPGWAIMARTGGLLAVVDVDTKNGADVEKTRQLLDGLGVRIFAELETPGTDDQGRRGRHFCIAGHPDLPSCSELDGWDGIDVLSYGRLWFLPGTQRPKYNGAGYDIVFDDLDALADGGDPDGAEAFADWAAERRAKPEQFAASKPWQGGEPDARRAAYLQSMLTGMLGDLSAMGKDSGRNIAVFNKAMKCGNFIAGAGLDEKKATDLLLEASRQNGLVRDDGERSVKASIRSGIKNGKAKPRAVPDPKDDGPLSSEWLRNQAQQSSTSGQQSAEPQPQPADWETDFWTSRPVLEHLQFSLALDASAPGRCLATSWCALSPIPRQGS
jgi:hypothetical protein